MSETDVSRHIQAKSDQLNSDDLVTGPITVQITGVTVRDGGEQPVTLKISGGHMPFKPSKTVLRVLVACWGTTDASKWVGKWMTLYREATVLWAGQAVGGIRVKAVSDIAAPVSLSLQYSKGKKSTHAIAVLKPQDQRQQGAATANLDKLLKDNGLTRADVDRWLEKNGKPTLDKRTPEKVAELAGWLAGRPATIAEIKALVPAPATTPTPTATGPGDAPADDFPGDDADDGDGMPS